MCVCARVSRVRVRVNAPYLLCGFVHAHDTLACDTEQPGNELVLPLDLLLDVEERDAICLEGATHGRVLELDVELWLPDELLVLCVNLLLDALDLHVLCRQHVAQVVQVAGLVAVGLVVAVLNVHLHGGKLHGLV